jgi:anaerobic selenocysteine-containing dehydrogenase
LEPPSRPEILHGLTTIPAGALDDYHSWGSQNAWLRQITAANRLYMQRARAEGLGLRDDDWVWIISAIGRVRAQVKLIEGVNRDTSRWCRPFTSRWLLPRVPPC